MNATVRRQARQGRCYQLTIASCPGYYSTVASIIIRNLDEAVARRLRLQARLKGVAMEQEARRILTEGTRVSRRDILVIARSIRARQKPHTSRAEDLIREDRDR